MWGNMMGWGYGPYGYGGGWAFFGVMHMLLWWVLIVLAIVVLARWGFGRHRGPRHESEDRALAILRERYARGEIDKADYEARKRDLAQ